MRRFTTGLRSTGNEVVLVKHASAISSLTAAGVVDLAVVELDERASADRILASLDERDVPVLLITSKGTHKDGLAWFCAGSADHVYTDHNDVPTLLTAIEKVLRQDAFGIDKHLSTFGAEVCTFDVRGTSHRDLVVEGVADYLRALGVGADFAEAMAMVSNELITNAMIHAPRNGEGIRKYSPRDLVSGIELAPGEFPSVQYTCDGENFVLAVTDYFGSLEDRLIRNSLRRANSSAARRAVSTPDVPGLAAGHGLGAVHASCRQLSFHLQPGECTQIIAVGNIWEWARDVAADNRSIQIIDAGTNNIVESDGVPQSIVVSETMRQDIRSEVAIAIPAPVVAPAPKYISEKVTAKDKGPSRGQLLVFPESPLGIDTMFGLIHGAPCIDRVLELGLRFLSTCYRGAVVYVATDDALSPWFGCGTIADWPACAQLEIPLDAGCTLAHIARHRLTTTFEASPRLLADVELSRLTSWPNEPTALALSIEWAGRLRYVFYAFSPRFDRPMARRVVDSLHSELSAVIGHFLNEIPPQDRGTPPTNLPGLTNWR